MWLWRPIKRKITIYPHGTTYNLLEIFESINEEYFKGGLSLPITWFGNPFQKVKSSRTLGSYHLETGLIRIHRLLDHPHFPPYFISWIVYHEMLHHVYPPLKRTMGGRRAHHPRFEEKERSFRYYVPAKEWEQKHRKLGLSYGRPQ